MSSGQPGVPEECDPASRPGHQNESGRSPSRVIAAWRSQTPRRAAGPKFGSYEPSSLATRSWRGSHAQARRRGSSPRFRVRLDLDAEPADPGASRPGLPCRPPGRRSAPQRRFGGGSPRQGLDTLLSPSASCSRHSLRRIGIASHFLVRGGYRFRLGCTSGRDPDWGEGRTDAQEKVQGRADGARAAVAAAPVQDRPAPDTDKSRGAISRLDVGSMEVQGSHRDHGLKRSHERSSLSAPQRQRPRLSVALSGATE